MADSTISNLQTARVINDDDYFVLEQRDYSGTRVAKKLTGSLLTDYLNRRIVNVSVTMIEAGGTASARFNKLTGDLDLQIPLPNGIRDITQTADGRVAFIYDNGEVDYVDAVRGDTGKSAFEYAKDRGYTGSELDFGDMMLTVYEAGINEQTRKDNETQRLSDFLEMQNQFAESMDEFDELKEYLDSYVEGVTLYLYKGGVNETILTL